MGRLGERGCGINPNSSYLYKLSRKLVVGFVWASAIFTQAVLLGEVRLKK
jgi:hypothetical protein